MSRSSRAAVLLGMLFAALGPNSAPVAAQSYLYVASQEDVTVAVIDMETHALVETVDLKELGFSPTAKAHHTAVEPDLSLIHI